MKASGINVFFEELDAGLETVPPDQVQKTGLTNVLARPPYESLPQGIKGLIESLEGLEPVEQLNLIHQFTRDTVKYQEGANNSSEAVQTFAQTLTNPKGDCDDIAVFESGLIKYANEQGVAHFDDVAVVGGIIQYNVPGVDVANDPLEHNFIVVSQNGQVFYLDNNAPHVGTGDAAGGGFKSSLATSKGGSVDADVFVNRIDVVYGADGSVSASPNAELAADKVAPSVSAAPQPAPTM